MDKVVHFEIPADNVDRAQKFYEEVFGWKITHVPEMNYFIVHTVDVDEKMMPKEVGAINGGITKRESNESVVIVIGVPSIDDHIKKAEEKGAKVVMPKMNVGDMGFYAKIEDTEGNVIGIWENKK